VHPVPDNDGAGHFNVLRGHLSALPARGAIPDARGAAGVAGVAGVSGISGISGIEVSILDIAVGALILCRAQDADAGTMLRYRWP